MTESILRARDLVIGYETPLTQALNFHVGPGEILVVLGESGCGKSTLLSTLSGITRPLSGEILLGEKCLSGVPIHRRNIGLVFQDPLLFPHLSLLDNMVTRCAPKEKPRKKLASVRPSFSSGSG